MLAAMTNTREDMESAIKQMVLPKLRELGFKGSLPHFRRILDVRVDLLSFQYHSSGGSFVVEIAKAPADGITTSWGKVIPASKIKASDINPFDRLRLGASPEDEVNDHWFEFSATQPLQIAEQLINLVEQQAIPWWNSS